MRVQVMPTGWRASCRDHGPPDLAATTSGDSSYPPWATALC